MASEVEDAGKPKPESLPEDEKDVSPPEMTTKPNKPRYRRRNNNTGSGSPLVQGVTPALKDYTFVYNQLHTKKWITAKKCLYTMH